MKQHPKLKSQLTTALIVSVVYTAIQYFALSRAATFGFMQLLGTLKLSTILGGGLVTNYLFLLMGILVPALLLYLLLSVLKKPHAFKTAVMSTMIAYLFYTLLTPFVKVTALSLVLYFVLELVSFFFVVRLVEGAKKQLFTWLGVIVLIAFNLFVLPYLSNYISRVSYAGTSEQQMQAALNTLDFVPYFPAYIPKGLEVTRPKLNGYQDTKYANENIVYEIGNVEFRLSKVLKNQDKILNFQTNCDISTLWFEMSSSKEVGLSRITRSLDNLAICNKVGMTETGQDIYAEGREDSQYTFYYMAIGDTNIVAQYEKMRRPRYSDDFEKEIIKIFSSMQKLNNARITQGRP